MKQTEMFGGARWVQAPRKEGRSEFTVLRSTFTASAGAKASIRVIGLGIFHCYLNGMLVTDDLFLPLATDYEERVNYPVDEKVTGYRMYVPEFDLTPLLREGDNVLAIHYGGGLYTSPMAPYGEAKAIYRIQLTDENGEREIVSSENDRVGGSFVTGYNYVMLEEQDYRLFDDACLGADFDDSGWDHAIPAKPVETDYLFTDCPADRVQKELGVSLIGEKDGVKVYDCGVNMSGFPVLDLSGAAAGERTEILFSENALADGSLDMTYHHGQRMTVTADGTNRTAAPAFTWFGFRYFSVKGNAKPTCVRFLHTDVKVTSTFDSDSEILNWLYKTYLHTQLCNMHTGIPSDCPHIERRGYTGDGQLTCHAVMNLTDARRFYEKWIGDISDCQDVYTGHVQYTAPYFRCGGGPGGWGCAIIEVPYQYYRHYGDKKPLAALYGQMLRYFDFLEAHSLNNLVVSDKAGEWCLGDWCPPIQVVVPAPFVNNYFYVKSLLRMVEIARLVGRDCDVPLFEERIRVRKEAMMAAYFNTWDGNFIGGFQGANAFAVDIGIGDSRTYANLVNYYRKLGRFDTGIAGTDILIRVLFEHGDGDLAVALLTSEDRISFAGMKEAGATTLWENWPDATWDRSRNHPMFGAVTAYLFDYLLGIRQEAGDAGYEKLVIAPVFVKTLSRVSGSRCVPAGEVAVSYTVEEGVARCSVTVPEGVTAVFRAGGTEQPLTVGENSFEIRL